MRAIVDELKVYEALGGEFRFGNGIVFENYPHAISETADEVAQQEAPSTPPSTPGRNLNLNQLRPDQICVYRFEDAASEQRIMLYVSEYKPPHKLTAPHLRLGPRSMNIREEVVNRKTIPTAIGPEGQFKYHAEKLTASAITQTYHYMIEGGLEYGLLTTGELIVFLKVDWSEPGTLLYHVTEPAAEVAASPNHHHLCTSVGQYLAFTLMALGGPGENRLHGQDERRAVSAVSRQRCGQFRRTSARRRQVRRHMSPLSREGIDRSPYVPPRRSRRVRSQFCDPKEGSEGRGESSDDDTPEGPDSTSPADRRTSRGKQGTMEATERRGRDGVSGF